MKLTVMIQDNRVQFYSWCHSIAGLVSPKHSFGMTMTRSEDLFCHDVAHLLILRPMQSIVLLVFTECFLTKILKVRLLSKVWTSSGLTILTLTWKYIFWCISVHSHPKPVLFKIFSHTRYTYQHLVENRMFIDIWSSTWTMCWWDRLHISDAWAHYELLKCF